MIIEDDKKIRKELSNLVARYGYQTIVAEEFSDITAEFLEYGTK